MKFNIFLFTLLSFTVSACSHDVSAQEIDCHSYQLNPTFSENINGIHQYQIIKEGYYLRENFDYAGVGKVYVSQEIEDCLFLTTSISFTTPITEEEYKKFNSADWIRRTQNFLDKLPTESNIVNIFYNQLNDEEEVFLNEAPTLVEDHYYRLDATDDEGYYLFRLEVQLMPRYAKVTLYKSDSFHNINCIKKGGCAVEYP